MTTIKMVVEVEHEYEPFDHASPYHPLALAREHLAAAYEAAARWGSPDDALRFLIAELQGRRDELPPRPSWRPAYQKQPIPRALAKEVFERDAYRCVRCGSWHDLSVDHIHPESKGGTLAPDNLQTLCRSCNSSKGAR